MAWVSANRNCVPRFGVKSLPVLSGSAGHTNTNPSTVSGYLETSATVLSQDCVLACLGQSLNGRPSVHELDQMPTNVKGCTFGLYAEGLIFSQLC
jgi:hypothetical protein